jgi:hypothetical protein
MLQLQLPLAFLSPVQDAYEGGYVFSPFHTPWPCSAKPNQSTRLTYRLRDDAPRISQCRNLTVAPPPLLFLLLQSRDISETESSFRTSVHMKVARRFTGMAVNSLGEKAGRTRGLCQCLAALHPYGTRLSRKAETHALSDPQSILLFCDTNLPCSSRSPISLHAGPSECTRHKHPP